MDLHGLYQEHRSGKSLRELARREGTSAGRLAKKMRAEGLVPRSRSEATALANSEREWEKTGNTNYDYMQALRARKAAIIAKWKSDRGCQACGESHVATLDLHHRDPAEKHPRLRHRNRRKEDGGKRTGGYFWRDLSYVDLAAELAKCVVLCSNCHRKLEWQERQSPQPTR